MHATYTEWPVPNVFLIVVGIASTQHETFSQFEKDFPIMKHVLITCLCLLLVGNRERRRRQSNQLWLLPLCSD